MHGGDTEMLKVLRQTQDVLANAKTDSWRDDFWGWGPNKDGLNHLGKLWMEVRKEVLSSI